MELPEIVARLGGADRVLYTDCDIIFMDEVVPELQANPCEYFAVAPEGVQEDYVNMNTGVMLMNIPIAFGKACRNFSNTFRKIWRS